MKGLIAIALKIWRNERTKPSCMLLKPLRDMMSRQQTMAYGWKITGAIHSTKISGNFGPKLNGSVRSNRKSFEKTGPPFEVVLFSRSDRLEFWLNGSRPTYCNLVQRVQRLRSTLFWTLPTDQRNYSNGSKELFKRLISNTSNGLENNFQRPFSTPPTGNGKNITAFPTPPTASWKLSTGCQRLPNGLGR